jgi:hypothetical protein
MEPTEKYYGKAVREFERGVRRDDIWGNPFVRAEGDVQKASAIYVELLAEHLSRAGVKSGSITRRSAGWTALEIFLCLVVSSVAGGLCTFITQIFLQGSGTEAQTEAMFSLGAFWILSVACAVFTWRRINGNQFRKPCEHCISLR